MNQKHRKFFFDKFDFQKEADDAKERRKNKKPPEPTFSLDDMAMARKEAFEEGREKGLQMATDSIEQKTEILVQSVIEKFQTVETAEDIRRNDFVDQSILMTFKALQTLLPDILDAEKETLIKSALENFFKDHMPQTTLTLSVNTEMVKPITKYAQMLNPAMQVEGDNALTSTQAKIQWVDGAFHFTPDTLMEQILQTIQSKVKIQDKATLDETVKTPHNKTEDKQTTSDHPSDQTQQDS